MVPWHLVVAWGLFVFAGCWGYVFLSGTIWGSGWAPTPKRQLEAAASLLRLEEGDTVYDLGSGFGGAMVFFAKQYHVSAIGVEVDPLRCYLAKRNARRHGVSARVNVHRGNLLDVDLRQSSKVFFFLTPLLMRRLQEKIANEMPEGSRVVSVDHHFPDWKPADSVENVHLYLVGRKEGNVSQAGPGILLRTASHGYISGGQAHQGGRGQVETSVREPPGVESDSRTGDRKLSSLRSHRMRTPHPLRAASSCLVGRYTMEE
jgi:SAM-dependent methyltransferase